METIMKPANHNHLSRSCSRRQADFAASPVVRRNSIAVWTLYVVLVVTFPFTSAGGAGKESYYTEGQVYMLRPDPGREKPFGSIGVTGLMVRIYKDVTLKVESTMPGSPAAGMFKKGEIITGINGLALKGKNPFVVLGGALTSAEAADGRMVFDVVSPDGKSKRKQTVRIPVLGSYSKTWPLDCKKSKTIIRRAADFYADRKKFDKSGIPGALACLFLLSTGDDKYLPRVKEYFDSFPDNVEAIGEHTWNNGYNGVACAEYYLRTGDASVLPIIQYYCDDAKKRQKFGCSWVHWGTGVSPGYVAGGLLNAAGAQLLTTLLLGKECGVKVDDETLLGSLRFFYRFAGRGTVPYGDHRGEGGLGSNGKDGMIAAAMQIATGASGDGSIYGKARDYLAMSMVTSYPVLVVGHGDEGRGDGIWRSIVSSYLMDREPELYRTVMDRLTWWHDLSREPGGSIGIGTLAWQNGVIGSSGAGVGLSYTSPLRTLRITGASRSKYAKKFTLPEHLWGTKTDLAFHSIDHNPKYYDYGPDEPVHIPFYTLGGAYQKPKNDLKTVSLDVMLKNVYHKRYMIRAQAAKALRVNEKFTVLEKLLRDPDPRVRRAALDGLIDYNYWFTIGRNHISTEQFSPAMLEAIRKMLSDPEESWWVVDGALMALKFARPKDIFACRSLIMPWTKHSDWWLRESAFSALSGLEKNDALYLEVVSVLLKVMTEEYHTQPRARMLRHLEESLKRRKKTSPAGRLIMAGLKKAVGSSEIKSGVRSPEGAYNVTEVVNLCLESDPAAAAAIAQMVTQRFSVFSTGDLIRLVAAPNSNREGRPSGLYPMLKRQPPDDRERLTALLFNDYRKELLKRMKADLGVKGPLADVEIDMASLVKDGGNGALVDTILDLTELGKPVPGWTPLGRVKPADRMWRFTSFDPQREKDRLHPREKKRFRDIQPPDHLKGWYRVDYDDSSWRRGRAPVGIGKCRGRGGVSFENSSAWGKGEFLVMRTTFTVDDLDYDLYRLSILARQGYHVYLNGREIQTYIWWKNMPHYRAILLNAGSCRHLKKGVNVLAAYGNVEYDQKTNEPLGQMDLFIEGLKLSDLE